MSTPRVGGLGVATTKADLLTVDPSGDLERFPAGTDVMFLMVDASVTAGLQYVPLHGLILALSQGNVFP